MGINLCYNIGAVTKLIFKYLYVIQVTLCSNKLGTKLLIAFFSVFEVSFDKLLLYKI